MEHSRTPIESVLYYKAKDSGWMTPNTIANITGQTIGSVTDELEELQARGLVTKKINCGGGIAWVYHLVPRSPDLARKLGALDEVAALANDHLAQTFREIQADLRLMHEMGVGKGG